MTTTTQNGTPTPTTNGATTQTQTPAPGVQTQTPAEVATLKAQLAEQQAREVTLKRELVVGRQQHQRERDQQKATFAEKLKSADEYERLRKTASVDKLSAAKALLGDNFLEELNSQAASGGAPTAAAMQNALERVREDTLREVEERTKKQQTEQQNRETQAEQAARTQLGDEATFFYEQVETEYPLLGALGDKARVGEVLASNINGPMLVRFRQALAAGDADARVKLYREVAEKLEGSLVAIAERAAAAEKYAPKLREKLTPPKTPATVTGSSQSLSPSPQQRSSQGRSLNNDIATGSTPAANAPQYRSDAERTAAALQKYNEAIAAKNGR